MNRLRPVYIRSTPGVVISPVHGDTCTLVFPGKDGGVRHTAEYPYILFKARENSRNIYFLYTTGSYWLDLLIQTTLP